MSKYRIVPGEAPETWVIERVGDALREAEPLLLFDTKEAAQAVLARFFASTGSVGAARTPVYLVAQLPGFRQDVDGHLFLASAAIARSRKLLERTQRNLARDF
jgi:hypothetical protein